VSPEKKACIEADASRAAKAGLTYQDACPYPFRTQEGLHWLACYTLSLPTATPCEQSKK